MAILSRKGRPETHGWLRRNTYLLLGASVWSVILGASLSMNLGLDQHSMVDFALAEARIACGALTLISPSLTARQGHDLRSFGNGSRGHITSLSPVSPKNGPGDWERNTLKRLAAGAAETSQVRDIDGRSYVSLVRSLVIQSTDNSDYVITTVGVEFLESHLPSRPVLRKLLQNTFRSWPAKSRNVSSPRLDRS